MMPPGSRVGQIESISLDDTMFDLLLGELRVELKRGGTLPDSGMASDE
jgi:hypothetical protein